MNELKIQPKDVPNLQNILKTNSVGKLQNLKNLKNDSVGKTPNLLKEMSQVVIKDFIMNDADSENVLNFLEIDETQILATTGEHPEFLELEVCLDSGAGDHVLAKVDVPGYAIEPSAGSLAGLHFVAAGGKRIPMEGQANIRFNSDEGGEFHSCFQVAAVTRPLWSVGRICDRGYSAVFTSQDARILDQKGVEVCHFRREGGLYLGTMRMRNPNHESFRRQGA